LIVNAVQHLADLEQAVASSLAANCSSLPLSPAVTEINISVCKITGL